MDKSAIALSPAAGNGHERNQPAPPLILLAEDNEANISTFDAYLSAQGYRIVIARNGPDAVEMAQTHQPQIILMDIQLPQMDGLTAIEKIRACADLTEVPIVALTALAMPGDCDRCLEVGANAYLSKPISLKKLVQTIQSLLPAPEVGIL